MSTPVESKSESKVERYQPYFLVDKGFYQVLVWDPDQSDEILVNFGDSNSPNITISLLEKDPKTLKLREEYLAKNPGSDDARTPEYWMDRYVWLSGKSFKYYMDVNEKKMPQIPTFPAPNAIDPPYHYPVIAPGYGYGAPYYTRRYYPYYPTYHTYYPYYSNRRYTGGNVALAGLAGLALGGLLF